MCVVHGVKLVKLDYSDLMNLRLSVILAGGLLVRWTV